MYPLQGGPLDHHSQQQHTLDNEGNQQKCEEVCEPWNEFCTAKLKEVIQAGCDAFAWQKKPEALKGMDFNQWLKPRHIALRPLLWEVCCDAYTRFKSSYEAAKSGNICFSVRRFELDYHG